MKSFLFFLKEETEEKSKGVIQIPTNATLPKASEFSQFTFYDENIKNFTRIIYSKVDCFINALELIGVDKLAINLLRVGCYGIQYTASKMLMTFVLLYKKNFEFVSYGSNAKKFLNKIKKKLQKGHVCFVAYTFKEETNEQGHVFLIGRDVNDKLLYLEPASTTQYPNGLICELSEDNCLKLLDVKTINNFYILKNSKEELTIDQLRGLGFSI